LHHEKDVRVRDGNNFGLRGECVMTRVLVIDDDKSVGAAIQMMLACQGCDTVLAPDADTGVQAFEASKFDVVMIDIFMPGIDGLKAIKGFRERAPSMPIVAMSGFRFRQSMGPGLDVLGMATELGATSCLRKPFAPQQLMAAINSGLESAFAITRVAGNLEPAQGSSQ
jgi:CheY-like chemotaxis protein